MEKTCLTSHLFHPQHSNQHPSNRLRSSYPSSSVVMMTTISMILSLHLHPSLHLQYQLVFCKSSRWSFLRAWKDWHSVGGPRRFYPVILVNGTICLLTQPYHPQRSNQLKRQFSLLCNYYPNSSVVTMMISMTTKLYLHPYHHLHCQLPYPKHQSGWLRVNKRPWSLGR